MFFGRATTVNQLREPLQRFVRERALQGGEPTQENLDRAIDTVIRDLHPHLVLTAVGLTILQKKVYVYMSVDLLPTNLMIIGKKGLKDDDDL